MATWLVCKRCRIEEPILADTPIVGCNRCGEPRYAVNDNGQPMLLWSKIHDFDSWEEDETTGAAEPPGGE